MSKTESNLFNDLFQNVREMAETNLRLQHDMLLGWTRLWPNFLTPGTDWPDGLSQFRRRMSSTVLDAARCQRAELNRQFETAIASFDQVLGAAEKENGRKDNGHTQAQQQCSMAASEQVPVRPVPQRGEQPTGQGATSKNIYQKVAVVTGAASGIGKAVAWELAQRGARTVILVDRSDSVLELADSINESLDRPVAVGKVGNATDEGFRKRVFDDAAAEHDVVSICVPAAGITRDALAVHIDKATGKAEIYPMDTFRQVTEVNLLAPIYWAIEMVARIAEDRRQRGLKRWEPEETTQGAIVFLGSVSSQGNKGQISYAVAKAGLEGAAATLMKEAMFHGVRCGIIHPGFTDTPMAQALGQDYLNEKILPYTQLRRLIRPDEIADAICFMISNSAVSGELWADAGWHPPA